MRKKKTVEPPIPYFEMAQYLWDGGWLQGHNGWWHPPSCLASWPIDQAYAMAKRDEEKGQRMTAAEVAEYLAELT